MKVTDFIIFIRINNSIDNSLKIPENKKYKWGGMKNKSNCWFFPLDFFKKNLIGDYQTKINGNFLI